MHDAPSPQEILTAVKSFMDNHAMPQLSGHAAFHARVASNLLATLMRELETRPEAESIERAGLQSLLAMPHVHDLVKLNAALCSGLRNGQFDLETPGLLQHLKTTTIAQLSVDQPGYSGLQAAIAP